MSTSVPPPGVPPASIEPGSSRGGCARTALIGCGVAGAVVLVAFAIFVMYARRRPEAITDLMMRQIGKSYAPDVTAEDKREVEESYAGFRKAVVERRVGRGEMERLRAILPFAGGAVTHQQVRDLVRLFRESAGQTSPTSPTPSGRETPTIPLTPSVRAPAA